MTERTVIKTDKKVTTYGSQIFPGSCLSHEFFINNVLTYSLIHTNTKMSLCPVTLLFGPELRKEDLPPLPELSRNGKMTQDKVHSTSFVYRRRERVTAMLELSPVPPRLTY